MSHLISDKYLILLEVYLAYPFPKIKYIPYLSIKINISFNLILFTIIYPPFFFITELCLIHDTF